METTTTLVKYQPVDLPQLTPKRVVEVCLSALRAQHDYSLKALIAGQVLIEYRASIGRSSQNGKSSIHGRNQHSNGEGWLTSIEEAGITKSTAYRWMDAAERVAHLQLNIPLSHPLPMAIDVEGISIPLSQALTAPEKELPKEALQFRQNVFDFMEDRTLSEALSAAVDGQSPGHRITRASAGKTKGGAGNQDRKEFEKFAAEKLRHLTTFVTSTKKVDGVEVMTERKLSQNQKAVIITRFTEAVSVWPRWLVAAIVESGKAELKLSDIERAGRKNPFKA